MTELNLSKGESLDLSKDGVSLSEVDFGIGWTAAANGTYDLDSSVAIFNGQQRTDVVYFKKLQGKGIKHSGDDLTGGKSADGPDEVISVNLNEVDGDRVEFIVTLYNARTKGQNLSEVRDAFVQVTDRKSGERLAKFTLSDSDMSGAAMHFGGIQKDASGNWSFKAIGKSLGMIDLNEAIGAV